MGTSAHGRRSALAHLGLAARAAAQPAEGAGVVLAERPFRAQVALRGVADEPAFREAVERAVGAALPVEPKTVTGPETLADGARILWLGPDEWLVVAAGDDEGEGGQALQAGLQEALEQLHAAAIDVSDGRTVIVLAGRHARDVLAKGCPLDLHPRSFGPGRCAETLLAKAHVILHQVDAAPTFEIYVHRSFADYLWAWLEDAAQEYGSSIIA